MLMKAPSDLRKTREWEKGNQARGIAKCRSHCIADEENHIANDLHIPGVSGDCSSARRTQSVDGSQSRSALAGVLNFEVRSMLPLQQAGTFGKKDSQTRRGALAES